MKPVIVLAGRPNVGKSTLFNRMTRSRDALVADFPGLTRDRRYGDGELAGWPYVVVDTGGLQSDSDVLQQAVAEQTRIAIREADLVIFMVDGRGGLTSADEEIAATLRRDARRYLLAVNKTDGIGDDRAMLEFHGLGIDPIVAIAASHGRGMQTLLDAAADSLGVPETERAALGARRRRHRIRRSDAPEAASGGTDDRGDDRVRVADPSGTSPDDPADTEMAAQAEAAAAPHEARLAVVGRPNVGKSTFVNRLLGEERVLASAIPGTTRDTVEVPFEYHERPYRLIDTAGVRRRGKVSEAVEIFSIIKTLEAIEHAHVVVVLIDAVEGATEQDLNLIGRVIEKGRALVVAMNKWDAIQPEERERLRDELARRVPFLDFTRIHYISARHGSGIGDLMKSVHRAHRSAFIDLSTSRLTRLLETAVREHAPPLVQGGRRIKLRYAHQGGINPPIVVIHGNRTDHVPRDYERYLANHFRRALRLFGTPLRIEFKSGDNPFDAARAGRPGKRRSAARKS